MAHVLIMQKSRLNKLNGLWAVNTTASKIKLMSDNNNNTAKRKQCIAFWSENILLN